MNFKKKLLIAEKSNEQNYSIQNYISVIWLSIHLFQQIEIDIYLSNDTWHSYLNQLVLITFEFIESLAIV